jgi:hypothetical protein
MEAKMRSRLFVQLSALALAVSSTVSPALAHHGWAGQGNEAFELSGTVHTALSRGGPHATMQIKDKSGQVWDLTLASPARTEEAGLKQGVVPVGAMVTIKGKRSTDPKRFEVKTERVTYGKQVFDVYPNRS